MNLKLNESGVGNVTEVSHPHRFEAYVDGAASGNPGPGGWGAVIAHLGHWYEELGGSEAHTTNNRMELVAALEALKWIAGRVDSNANPRRSECVIWSDSTYVIKGITEWIKGWKARGWKNSQKEPVANVDLWEQLDAARAQLELKLSRPIRWQYVKGHSGNPGNDRADVIAASRAQRAGVGLTAGRWDSEKLAPRIWPNA